MYHGGVLAGGAGAVAGGAGAVLGDPALGNLPMTGLNLVWVMIAGFALLMAAGAIWRMVPRRQA